VGDHSSADQLRSGTADRARVVEEAVRMASSLAERATRDVRELTRELADAGRADGAGSVSFLMGRLMELAGGVTSFVQELQHYELVRRNPLPVVGLVAPAGPVVVVVRSGGGHGGSGAPDGEQGPAASFLVENDLARTLDGLSFVAGRASDGHGLDGPSVAPVAGRDGQACGTVRLTVGPDPWVWGERRRVDVHVELSGPLAGDAEVAFTAVATVGATKKPARHPVELIVRDERSGAAP
jgi:hypothetical protein